MLLTKFVLCEKYVLQTKIIFISLVCESFRPQWTNLESIDENIATVAASVDDNHELSIRSRSRQLGLCHLST